MTRHQTSANRKKNSPTGLPLSVPTPQKGSIRAEAHLPAPYSAHLSAGLLSWKWTPSRVDAVVGKVQRTMQGVLKVRPYLWRSFAKLADTDPEKVRAFAERWGPLHLPEPRHRSLDSEPVEAWQFFAKLAQSLIGCTGAVTRQQSGMTKDWRLICDWLKQTYDPGLANPALMHQHWVIYRRGHIAAALNKWYSCSAGNMLLTMEREKIIMAPTSTTLFGIIGIQLAYAMLNASEMLVCHHCEGFFTASRKATNGMRSFCPTCRRSGKPALYAMRDYRRRLHSPFP